MMSLSCSFNELPNMSEFHVCYKGSNVIFYQLYEHLKENSRNELNYVINYSVLYMLIYVFSVFDDFLIKEIKYTSERHKMIKMK